MIRICTWAALALVALGTTAAAQSASDAQRPALKASTIVTGEFVRIGDLIDNAGVVAGVPIFRSPDLGGTGLIAAARVIEAVRPHALLGLDASTVSEIAVTRASRVISTRDIETRVSAALVARYAISNANDLSLYFERAPRPVHLDPTSTATPRIDRVSYDPRSGRFEATLEIVGPPTHMVRVAGTAVITGPVVTLARALARGEIVKPADLTIERRPRREIPSDAIIDPQAAVGLAARGPIIAGRIMRTPELMRPEMIARNDNVTLIYEVPGVFVTSRGKALESGAEGDLIEVTNLQSKRAVHGTIIAPGRVVVSQMLPRALAKAEPVKADSPIPALEGAQ